MKKILVSLLIINNLDDGDYFLHNNRCIPSDESESVVGVH